MVRSASPTTPHSVPAICLPEDLAGPRVARSSQCIAILYSLVQSARINDVDSQSSLAGCLAPAADHPVKRLDELLPCGLRCYLHSSAEYKSFNELFIYAFDS